MNYVSYCLKHCKLIQIFTKSTNFYKQKRPSINKLLLVVVINFIIVLNGFGQFITTWKTDNTGTSSNTSITIPMTGNYDVDWNNDGTFDESVTGPVTHDFGTAGTYTIAIQGASLQIKFNDGGDKLKILDIVQWGNIQWTSMNRAFYGASNLNSSASDSPDLGAVTNMNNMFNGASSFNGNVSGWIVNNVMYMSNVFDGASFFNKNLNSWNVSNVESMKGMFSGASSFNGNISSWSVSNVEDMQSMFNGASSFNGNLSNWIVNNVTKMSAMFFGASSFNGNISTWNVSSVINMFGMFNGASSFNRNLSSWNIALVTSMTNMLSNSGMSVTNYDNTLIGWDVNGATNLSLGANGLLYCDGELERASLIAKGWTITGDAKDCSSLPVELLNFSATPENETILLDWNTATETNNKGFELQRSPDGQQWQTITFIKGHGNKITSSHYDYMDRPNASGTFYYRLQQIDFDGAIDISNIVTAKLSSLLDEIIVFPNPIGIKDLTIQFSNKGNFQIKVFNVYGKLLLNNNMIVNEKAQRKKLSTSDWQSGIYLLEITSGSSQFTQVLIKQRE